MNSIIRKLFSLLLLSMAITGLTAWTAQATPITTTVTGVVTKASIDNGFGVFGPGDRIFAVATYEDSLISPVGKTLLTTDSDPSYSLAVMAGPSYRLDLADFSQMSTGTSDPLPGLVFQDGALAGIFFNKVQTRFDLSNNRPLTSFGTFFQSIQVQAKTEFFIFLEGNWDFSNTGGGPTGNTPVPEPSTFLLFGSGIVGVIAWRWRKTRRSLTS